MNKLRLLGVYLAAKSLITAIKSGHNPSEAIERLTKAVEAADNVSEIND